MLKKIWAFLESTNLIVTLILSLIALSGLAFTFIPSAWQWFQGKLNQLVQFGMHPIELPLIIIIIIGVLATIPIYRLARSQFSKRSKNAKLKIEPTHEKLYMGFLVRYYLEGDSQLPVITDVLCNNGSHPIVTSSPFAPNALFIECDNFKDSFKINYDLRYTPEVNLRLFFKELSDRFEHDYKEKNFPKQLIRE